MAVTAKKKPAAGSTENMSETYVFMSGKLAARVIIATDAHDGASTAQDITDFDQITMTDILGLTPHTLTTLS